jgi:hypothetical protein
MIIQIPAKHEETRIALIGTEFLFSFFKNLGAFPAGPIRKACGCYCKHYCYKQIKQQSVQ